MMVHPRDQTEEIAAPFLTYTPAAANWEGFPAISSGNLPTLSMFQRRLCMNVVILVRIGKRVLRLLGVWNRRC